MTRPDDTEPSAEALAAAAEFMRETKPYVANTPTFMSLLALALDRFRAAGVREERERITAAIDEMTYDNLWGGQRRIGWDIGKEQALKIVSEPSP